MKNFNLVHRLLFPGIVMCSVIMSAQNYQDNFKRDICDCLQKQDPEETLMLNAQLHYSMVQKCFSESIERYVPDIEATIETTDVNERYQEGQKIRKNLFHDYYSELIYSCDFYFNQFVKGRELATESQKSVANPKMMELVNQQVAMTPNAKSYLTRGQLYFVSGAFGKAEQDFRNVLKFKSGDANAIVHLARTLEEQHQYQEAIVLLESLLPSSNDMEIKKLIAVVERRKGGRSIRVPGTTKSRGATRRTNTTTIPTTETDTKSTTKKEKDILGLFKLDDN